MTDNKVFSASIVIGLVGTQNSGKSTLLRRLKKENLAELGDLKELQTGIPVKHLKNIHHETTALDVTIAEFPPQRFPSLRRKWARRLRTMDLDGLLFLVDHSQEFNEQEALINSAFNWLADSVDPDPEKANQLTREKKWKFLFLITKIDAKSQREIQITKQAVENCISRYESVFPLTKTKIMALNLLKTEYGEIFNAFAYFK